MICATVGCEREVPRHEWPADKTLPIFCDPCLRAQALAFALPVEVDETMPPGTAEVRNPDGSTAVTIENIASADFGESSDFG